MKSLCTNVIVVVAAMCAGLYGCELVTPSPSPSAHPVGRDMIINEVFAIPPSEYFAYSWLELYNPTAHAIDWSELTYPYSAWVVGDNGNVLRSDDDGATWRNVYSGPPINFKSVTFPYPDTGYVVGDRGTVMRVVGDTLGGYTFTQSTLPPFALDLNVNDVSCVPLSPAAYLCGDSGLILWTLDRGRNWLKQQLVPTVKDLHSIDLVQFSAIYSVGDSSTLLKQKSRQIWSSMNPPPLQVGLHYYGVIFTQDTGWVVGQGGTMAITRTGGQNWTPLHSGVDVNLRGVFFSIAGGFTNGTGWAVGDSGVILQTRDYGTSWTTQPSGTTANLRDVKFADSARGLAVGDGGVILATSDGGKTWRAQQGGTANNLKRIFINPLAITQYNVYKVEIWAKRKFFFWQFPLYPPNLDVIVKADTGIVVYEPGLFTISQGDFTTGSAPSALPAGGFAVMMNDSLRFTDHVHSVGPANPQGINARIMIVPFDTVDQRNLNNVIPKLFVLWDLLESGEARIVRDYSRFLSNPPYSVLGAGHTVIDVVRWGNFASKSGDFFNLQPKPNPDYGKADDVYTQNRPMGLIPEWYSMARYSNDVGGDPTTTSTAASFYITNAPTPGWVSQRQKP